MEKSKKGEDGEREQRPDWLDLIAKPMPKFDPRKDVLKMLTKAKNKILPKKTKKSIKKAKYELSGGAVIFNIQKDIPYYLIVQYPTYWGFVKGKAEPGEEEEQTVYREAFEEVGLSDLKLISGFREVQLFYFKIKTELIRKEVVYLLARTNSWVVKLSHEHLNFKWTTYEDALKLMRVKGTRDLLKKAHERILKLYKLKG